MRTYTKSTCIKPHILSTKLYKNKYKIKLNEKEEEYKSKQKIYIHNYIAYNNGSFHKPRNNFHKNKNKTTN